jgi:predicted dehydrogenase
MGTNSKVGVAVIGTGRAGMIHAGNFARGVRGSLLVALADAVESSVRAAGIELGIAATYTDYRSALEHPGVDAVVIATPTSLHAEIAIAAAERGKHVLCEKPMAITVAECDAMLEATERAGVSLQIGFMRRYSEDFLAAKARIDAGDIGSVVQVKTLTHGPSQPKPWMYDLRHSNGPLAEVNSHDIDTVRWLSGSEFMDVYAIAGNFRTPQARSTHPDFYDQVLAIARMSNGSQGSISGAQGVQYAYDARCEILGTEGIITVGCLSGLEVVTCTRQKIMSRPSVSSWTSLFAAAYLREDTEFIQCILEEHRPRACGRDGRAAVALVNAGNQSIRERRTVALS